jgi:hypothetical protein
MKFVCWLWRGRGFWKRTATYDGHDVAVLASMLKRHGGHELICVHDGNFVIPTCIWQMPMPSNVAALPDYLPKLWAWSPEFHAVVGERFASIDLDVVLLGDVAHLLSGPEPVRLWDSAVNESYNTSLFAIEPGFGHQVWNSYVPESLAAARDRAVYWTGDQSWVAHVLGPGMPTFSESDGVIRYRPQLHRDAPPPGALAVFLCGPRSAETESEHSEWVRKHWR